MKVALLGATGFVGSAVLEEALDRPRRNWSINAHNALTDDLVQALWACSAPVRLLDSGRTDKSDPHDARSDAPASRPLPQTGFAVALSRENTARPAPLGHTGYT